MKPFLFSSSSNEIFSFGYSFNGKEKDDEITGNSGDSYDFGARMYDSRLGRWKSCDPIYHAQGSPFIGFDNNPIAKNDPNGKDAIVVVDEVNHTVTVTTTVFYWEPRDANGTYTGPVTTQAEAAVDGMNQLQNSVLPWDGTTNVDVPTAGGGTEAWQVTYATVFVPIQAKTIQEYETKAINKTNSTPGSDYLMFVDVAPGTYIDKYGNPLAEDKGGTKMVDGEYTADQHKYTVNMQSLRPVNETFGHEEGHALGLCDAFGDPASPLYKVRGNGASDPNGSIMSYSASRMVSLDEAQRQVTAAINLAKTTAGDKTTIIQKGGSGPGGVPNPNVKVKPVPN